jgi:hypothetical protein
LEINDFLSKSDRKALAAALNTLLASPTFASWREGATLDVGEWLTERDGRTPAVIVSGAHLEDEERALVLGVLLEEVLAWVRSLPGSQELRALVVFDEVDPQAPVAPGQKPILLASASRTIALFGLLVLMGALVGVAYFVLWALFYGQPLDNLTKLAPVFYGAASLFAPYAVNQIRSAVAGLGSATKPAAAQQAAKA